MKKPRKFLLLGTDNDGNRHRYSVEKNEAFKEHFVKFMANLGFEEERLKRTFIVTKDDDESVELKIKDIVDVCWNYKNERYDVDIFFGDKKIIFVIRANKRKDLINVIKKRGRWVKPLKVKKIKDKKGMKVPVRIVKTRK